MKLISWNVNGIRSIYKKGFEAFLETEQPDICCLQEIKIDKTSLSTLAPAPLPYESYFSCAKKPGYSGLATFTKDTAKPSTKITCGIQQECFDNEGRFLFTDHEKFLLYNTYFPSGTTGDARQEFKYQFLDTFFAHLQSLSKKDRDRLVICGDFNICHREIDIHHPEVATKRELSGFLAPERAWIDSLLEFGFIDSYRQVHGDKAGKYSWWAYRAGARPKNLGWRIDYFFVSKALSSRIEHADLLTEVGGSDHCPISLTLDL